MQWINGYGIGIVVLLLIPNLIYFLKEKGQKNLCTFKVINIIEQVTRYACMLFMVITWPLEEFGFSSENGFIVYFLGNIVLLVTYVVVWVLYFKKKSFAKEITLAIIPFLVFDLCGITLSHIPLMILAPIFGCARIFVTAQNHVERNKIKETEE